MKNLFIAFGLTLFVNVNVYAQEVHSIDASLAGCLDKNYFTAGMGNCTQKAYGEWEALLDYNYNELLGKLDKNQRASLDESQKAWVKYKDLEILNIKSFYSTKKGSMWGITALAEMLAITKSRALVL